MADLLDGRYEPVQPVGQGGEGQVVLAIDHQHDRRVALKIRPAGPGTDRGLLMSEARVLLSLRPHPSLPTVRDDFFDESRYVLVMDWVEGVSLAELLRRQGDPGLPVASVAGWLSQVARALDHLHTHNPIVVHGDVKPENIVLTPEGRVVLVDFGIARSAEQGGERAGTRGFQAPEGPVSPASDVYGLAATAVALLTGAAPAGGRPSWDGIAAEQAAAIEATLRRALASDPSRRPATAGDLVDRLEARLASALPTGVLTFLLTDIEGSAGLWDRAPQAMNVALDHHDQLVADAVEAHRGMLLRTRGDAGSAFAVFSSPSDALACACGLQREMVASRWPEAAPVRVRMALHTGEAQLRGQDYYGVEINRVSRLRDLARGEQILVSEATAALGRAGLPPGASLRPAGEHRLRGLDAAEPIFQLTHPALPAVRPPDPVSVERPGNLPASLTTFVGRAREVADAIAALHRSRLVTITGPGGVGKTRLALEAAAALSGEMGPAWVVELARVDGGRVAASVAAALGVRLQGSGQVLDAVTAELGARAAVLVLDNCEHVVDDAAATAARLLSACPGLRVLATSRERLSVEGEVVWPLVPLDVPPPGEQDLNDLLAFESVQLFCDRARAARPGFTLEPADAPVLARICSRLDGLPLALELAAARSRTLDLPELDRRLDDQLQVLTGGPRTADERHQTLRATIEWSHSLLTEAERAVMRRLSVFPGGATLDAIERVCGGEPAEPADVAEVLGQLIDRSLVVQDRQARGQPRYRLLATIRAFAAEQLAAAGEADSAAIALLEWAAAMSWHAAAGLMSEGQVEVLGWIEGEHANLLAALDWASQRPDHALVALQVAVALAPYWELRGHAAEARHWLSEARARAQAVPDELVARSLMASGDLAQAQRDFAAARPAFEEALAVARGLEGDETKELEAEALQKLGGLAFFEGDAAAARPLLEASLDLARRHGATATVMTSTLRLGAVNRMRGDYTTAEAQFAEALDLARRLGDQRHVAIALIHLGSTAQATGDRERSRIHLEEALALCRALDFRQYLPPTLGTLGNLATVEERLADARSLYEESLDLARRLGDRTNVMMTLFNLANVAELDGEDARSIYDESLSEARALGHKRGISLNLRSVAHLAVQRGDVVEARALLTESLAIRREIDDQRGTAECLEGFAEVLLAEGEAYPAAQLLGAGQAVRDGLGDTREPAEQDRFQTTLDGCRRALGDTKLGAAVDEGAGLPIEEAVALTGP